ncbi:MAG: V-type ATPase subunit [Clostridia bacterium]|nr:V-type ATPase subunit [Clostridia bacterium]
MPSSKASNAILAKARAMYGKCLTDNDYQQLEECKTVPEVAAYLKTRTSYRSALTGLNENDVHRGQLEPLLKQNLYYDVFALSRYATDNSMIFSDFFISGMEIEQIIRCLTLVNLDKPDEYVYSMPLSLDKFTKISLKELAGVRSYADIEEVLKGSRYSAAIQKFRPKEGEQVRIAELENELKSNRYASVLQVLEHSGSKRENSELKDLFYAILDFNNIARIIRLKKYYQFKAEQIKPMLIPYGKLKPSVIDEFCAAESVSEIFELSRSTYLGKLMAKLQYNDQTQITDALISMYCKHHLRLSANPAIVMISYVYLKEIELKNIVNIIEGTRYGISAEEKQKLLVR